MLVICAVAGGACGFGELDGLRGPAQEGPVDETDSGSSETDGAEEVLLEDSSDEGGSDGEGDEDGSGAGGSDGEGGSSDAGGAGGTAEPDGSMDAGDAAGSGDAGDAMVDARIPGTVSELIVYDTGTDPVSGAPNASFWAIMTNFQLGPDAPDIWLDYPNAYALSIDLGAPALVGSQWIRTWSKSKLYTTPPGEAKITIQGTANVYLIVDDRATAYVNAAAAGWIDTGYNMGIWETASRTLPFSIWVKPNQTGEVYLPIQNFNNAFNYFVIIN